MFFQLKPINMKKALITLNLVFLVIICFLACNPQTEETACDQLHAKSYSGLPMDGYLNVDLAKEIADAYDADVEKAYISMGGQMTNKEDAHRVWFSLEKLKQYIWQIEDTLCKQGCNIDSMRLGVHFYFAKYPDSSRIKEYGVDPSYANHQTMFMTATYKGTNSNVDFDPWHIGPEKCKPAPLSTFLRAGTKKEGMMLKGEGDEGAGVLNHGDLAPPPDGSGGFPSTDN
jgi:hypothetical protein